MNTITQVTMQECSRTVSDLFETVFGRVGVWRARIEAFDGGHEGVVSRSAIDRLVGALVVQELSGDLDGELGAENRGDGLPVIGAGFVAAPGYIRDAPWHLAWWLGDANTFGGGSDQPRIRRLDAIEDPAAESFRDYTALEWWRVPRDTGRSHLTGPYVDYLCTDEYTLTLTMPVVGGHGFSGVVGADLYVRDVERALLPRLRAAGSPVTLVNSSNRIVLSTNARLATGSLLKTADPAPLETVHCGRTGLRLLSV